MKLKLVVCTLIASLTYTLPPLSAQELSPSALLDSYQCDTNAHVLKNAAGKALGNKALTRAFGALRSSRQRQALRSETRMRMTACAEGDALAGQVLRGPADRVGTNLIAFYNFNEGAGLIANDSSGVGSPLNLALDPTRVRWIAPGPGVEVRQEAGGLRSIFAATKINSLIAQSDRLTVETWVSPANLTQNGGRIFTVSNGIRNSTANLRLAQEAANLRVVLRANNSATSFVVNDVFAVADTPYHIAVTYDGLGIMVYINAELRKEVALTGADLPFQSRFPLTLANEATLDKLFLGKLFLAAVYNQALTPAQITTNFNAGYLTNGNSSSSSLSSSSSSSVSSISSSSSSSVAPPTVTPTRTPTVTRTATPTQTRTPTPTRTAIPTTPSSSSSSVSSSASSISSSSSSSVGGAPPVGWTQFPLAAGDRQIFVSFSQGNNSNDGLSPSTPVKNLLNGVAKLRDNSGDQLLLKKGDTWNGENFDVSFFTQSGVSATRRLLIGSYGTGPRPKVIPAPGTNCISREAQGWQMNNVAFVGIHFQAAAGNEYNDVCVAIYDAYQNNSVTGTIHNVLFEDDRFTRFGHAGSLQAIDGLTIRRCVLEDVVTRYQEPSSNEIYVAFSKNILIEENYVVNRILGVLRDGYERDSFFYINDDNPNTNITFRRNVLINKGPYGPIGVGLRTNAVADDNIFDGMYMAISSGGQDTPPSGMFPNGTHYHFGGNVILRGLNMASGAAGLRGEGIHLGYLDTSSPGTVVENNIIANKGVVSEDGTGIYFAQWYFQGYARNVTVQNNVIYNWNGIGLYQGNTAVSNLKFIGNEIQNPGSTGSENALVGTYTTSSLTFQNNIYSSIRNIGQWFQVNGAFKTQSQWQAIEPTAQFRAINYPAPDRSLASYAGTLGYQASTDGMIDAILAQQSRDTWNSALGIDVMLDYLREGFGR